MAGETVWPKPTFEQSPTRKARYRLLGDWHKVITSIVSVKGLTKVEVLNEYWKFTVSLRKRDSGEHARVAVVVRGPSEHVFSAELVTEPMAGTTETEVRETKSTQRISRCTGLGPTPTEFVYLHTVTANIHKRKKAEERVQQLESRATAAWKSCILLLGQLHSAKTSSLKRRETRPFACHKMSQHCQTLHRISRDTCSTF